MQSIIDAIESGYIENAEIVEVISSKPDAYALKRAEKHDIETKIICKNDYKDIGDRMDAICDALDSSHTDLVVLAGYLSILTPKLISRYARRIINIHPALLPKYGGKDKYGLNVHKAVIEAGEKESGATVHYVDEGIDTGEIIMQEKVPVLPDDTPETLAARVLEVEHKILPEAIRKIEKGFE